MLASVALELDEQTILELSDFGTRHGANLRDALLTVWAIFLYRLTNQKEFSIGATPAESHASPSNPNRAGHPTSVHVSVDLIPPPTAVGLLTHVESGTRNGFHPEAVRPGDPARQAFFLWRDTETGSSRPMDVQPMADATVFEGAREYELALLCVAQDYRLHGFLLYSVSIFDPSTIARFAENARVLIRSVINAENQSIDTLPFLGVAERSRILQEWSGRKAAFPSDKCVHELFEERAAAYPESTALIHGTLALSYRDLNNRANKLAHYLRSIGVGADTRIAICLERGFEMIISQLAVLKAGGAYVPLDPTYPIERLNYMLEDCSPVALVTSRNLSSLFEDQYDAGTPVLDVTSALWREYPETNLSRNDIELHPHHLAYVIYTSGSTGNPKGVLVEHLGLCNMATAQIRDYKVTRDSRVLQFSSCGFDVSVLEIYIALCQGATLVLPPPGEVMVGDALAAILLDLEISHAVFSPAVLATLSTENLFPSLRVLVVGGDRVPVHLIESWAKGRLFVNAYGPTEGTVVATLNVGVTGQTVNPSIGRPMVNARIYILDGHNHPVPTGVVGEIFIGGIGVARGYLNLPELTAERFIQDPFAGAADARMYKTGDLARWFPDGTIEFVGRNDFQIKIRGIRVEPGDVENAFRLLVPSIKECVVLTIELRGQTHLVAYYVVAQAFKGLDGKELSSLLNKSLPSHMVPSIFVEVEKMPLTPNGKIDRKALPQPVLSGKAEWDPPVGEVETAVCKVFAAYSGAQLVGRHDNFFALGGNSLGALLCIHRLRGELGQHVTLRQLIECPTAETLAVKLSTNRDKKQFQCVSLNTSRSTLYTLPGVGGDEPRLLRFRMQCEAFSQVVPIKYPDWSRMTYREHNADLLVDYIVEQINAIDMDKPVWLVGYSFGGYCALAVALRLVQSGRQVAFIALLDTDANLSLMTVPSAQMQFGSFFKNLWQGVLDLGRLLNAIRRQNFISVLALTLARWLTAPNARPLLMLAVRYRHMRLPIRLGYFLHRYLSEARQVWSVAHWWRAINERPTPLLLPVFLFRSEAHAADQPSDLGWQRHYPLLEVFDVRGSHETMLEPPYLNNLCQKIHAVITEISRSAGKTGVA